MKTVLFILTIMLVLLQVRLWHGDGSLLQVRALRQEIAVQDEKIGKLKTRNITLEAEILDLKQRLGAIEERARTDLGMIRAGESFYQYSPKKEKK